MTSAEAFSSHPAADRRPFGSLPVQICGAYEGSRNEDGTGMDFFPDIRAAREVYPDLAGTEGTDPEGERCFRFFGPIPHILEGQLVIRYESLAARLRFTGHKFSLIDDYCDVLRASGDTALIALMKR